MADIIISNSTSIPNIPLMVGNTSTVGRLFSNESGQVCWLYNGVTTVLNLTVSQINAMTGLDADLLEGHNAAYFATSSSVTSKADSSTVTAIDGRLTTAEGTITSLGTSKLNSTTFTSHTSATNPHNITADTVGKDTAQWNANKLQGKPITTTVPSSNDIHVFNGTEWVNTPIPTGGGGGGSTDTASNLGAGTGVYSTKADGDFKFKSLTASGLIAITTPVAGEVNIGTTAVSADTAITDGSTKVMMLATERTKLTGIADGATANSSNATLLARANHTGTQSGDTVIDAPILVTASTLTLDATHRNKTIICNNTANLVITIPQTVFDSYPGCSITILRKSATYTVTITAAAGVTMNGTVAGSKSISTQYKWASLYYEGSQVWNISGDVA